MLGTYYWNIKSMSWSDWEPSRMFVSSIYKVDSLLFVFTGLWWNILFQDKPICDSTFTTPISTISTARDNLVGWHSCNSRVWLHDKSRWLDTWCDMILTDIPIRVASWHQNVCHVTKSPNPALYCSMKSDRTGTQTQTLLELHQMLYHWAIRSSRVLQCDRIPHSVTLTLH